MRCRLCSHIAHKAFQSTNIHGREKIDNTQYWVYFCPNCQSYSLEKVESKPDYYRLAYNTKYYPSTTLAARILNFISFSLRRQTILSLISKNKIDILDIGCGQGEFLASLPKDKFNLFGADINPQAVKLAQEKNIHVFSGDINQINFQKTKFDCITLWHVLEHLSEPHQTITRVFELLKPGGVVLAAVPCSQSLGLAIGKKDCFHLDSPRHLFIPSPSALKQLFSAAKFKKIHFANPFYDYPLDLFWSVRKSPFKFIIYPLYPFFKIFSHESILVSASK